MKQNKLETLLYKNKQCMLILYPHYNMTDTAFM